MHHGDAVCEPFRLVEVMRRQQDRQLGLLAETANDLEQLLADARVEPDRRLVEKEDARRRDERAGELEPTPLTAAVAAHGPIDERRDAERVRQFGDACLRRARLDLPQARVDLEVTAPGKRAVDDRLLEHDAADATGGQRLAHDVEAADARGPAGRQDRGRQDADGRRLARAVRPEQPEHLAGADLEIDPGDGLDASGVDLAELFDFDHGASSSFGPAVTSGAAFSSAL